MNTSIEITPTHADELPHLFALAQTTFAGMPGWNDTHVAGILNDDLVFVARDQGQLAGYIALRRDSDDSLLIEQLLVASGHERRGIGRRLLAYAEGYAISERVPSVRIVVEDTNHAARRLYLRLGFQPAQHEIFQRDLPQLQ